MIQDRTELVFLWGLGGLPVIWIALLSAPYIDDGLPAMLQGMSYAFDHPFDITITKNSPKTVLLFLSLYLCAIGMYYSTKRNYRRGVEHGSAKWGNPYKLNKKYASKEPLQDRIFTAHVRMSYDSFQHKRNLLTLVVGGSGAGKSRMYCKPNLMNANTSFVVTDPKGENLRDTGYLLEKMGYEVRVLDLINMEKSMCYNPFKYLMNDNDVQRLATNLFKATTPPGAQSQDPFWDTAANMLLLALIFYLKYEAPEEEQNFPMVMEMLRAGEVKEDDDSYQSPLDILFYRLEMKDPHHIAVKYYKDYHSGSAKTLKSIQITLAARLEKFNLSSVEHLTITDELNLTDIGEKKVALFALLPDNDTSFNFLISVLYTQLFQQLFYIADNKYKGALPIPVHFLMDEFANIKLPEDYDKILAVMRSRGCGVSMLIQNMASLKALFEKQHESIAGNCDEFLFLGGNEQSTHEYVSKLLGKETIDLNTYGKSTGHSGSYSTNYQISGRELMTPDEVRALNNEKAILFIRGEKPVLDSKYDIQKHPNVKWTPIGGAPEYEHAKLTHCVACIELTDQLPDMNAYQEILGNEYEIVEEIDL